MSRIVRVNQSNYNLTVQNSGTITFDTGGTGTVYVNGDFIVTGQTTNINSVNTNIEDNIIVLNKGELNSVVTKGSSGIEIDRGMSPNPQFLFSESVTWYDPSIDTIVDGGFVTQDDTGRIIGLRTISINPGSNDLSLIGAGDGADTSLVTVKGTNNYNQRVLNYSLPGFPARDPDIIPNIKAVIDYVNEHVPFKIQDYLFNPDGSVLLGDSVLQIFDSQFRGDESVLTLKIDNVYNAKWYSDRHEVQEILISLNTISTLDPDLNLILTSTSNNVEIDGILNLDDQLGTIYPIPDTTKIYSQSFLPEPPGKTGIFFTNNISSDELVAKNRALLFSMLF